jgi:uncharacterized membrane protein
MLKSLRFLPLAACLLAGSALAQAPLYIEFGNNTQATDVTATGSDFVVVGVNSLGNGFRWSFNTGVMTDIGPVTSGPRVSADGNVIAATTTGTDGYDRASRWVGGVWTQGLGLGAASGTSESVAIGISADGNTITGLGWVTAQEGHCYSWNQTTGVHDLGGVQPNPSSRGNAISANGSVIAGFHDQANGTRQGAHWVNGVEQVPFSFLDPVTSTTYDLGEAQGLNSAGTTIVGRVFYGAPAPYSSCGWRWDSGTGLSALPNLPGESDMANPVAVTDDGSWIVGDNGWDPWFSFSTLQTVLWINNVPQSFYGYLVAQGTQGLGAYTDLGWPAAISRDGGLICGTGGGFFAAGTPSGGWVVILPSAYEPGTSICDPGSAGVLACPCGNPPSGSGVGCNNSSNTGGAKLTASGFSSLAVDSLHFTTSGEKPNATSIVLQGTGVSTSGVLFGQGVRCAAGILKRLYVKTASAGAISAPTGADLPVHARSAALGDTISAGTHRYYGVYYRDPIVLGGCSALETYNITQQIDVTWNP